MDFIPKLVDNNFKLTYNAGVKGKPGVNRRRKTTGASIGQPVVILVVRSRMAFFISQDKKCRCKGGGLSVWKISITMEI